MRVSSICTAHAFESAASRILNEYGRIGGSVEHPDLVALVAGVRGKEHSAYLGEALQRPVEPTELAGVDIGFWRRHHVRRIKKGVRTSDVSLGYVTGGNGEV